MRRQPPPSTPQPKGSGGSQGKTPWWRDPSRRRPRQPGAPTRQYLASRWERERRMRRMLLAIGVFVILVVIGLLVAGYYTSRVAPGRLQVARVNETVFTAGDLVKNLKGLLATAAPFGVPIDVTSTPARVLNDMLQAELIRQNAQELNISISEEEIGQLIRNQFTPPLPQDQEADHVQQERAFRDALESTLSGARLSQEEYREFVGFHQWPIKARDSFIQEVPQELEQVYLHWIRVATDVDIVNQVQSRQDQDVPFAEVAQEFNTERSFGNEKGEVGWVPRGLFPILESTMFKLEVGTLSPPITGLDGGTYFMKITNGPEVREVSERMRTAVGQRNFTTWLNQQHQESELEVNLDTESHNWVVEQVAASQPPPLLPQR